MNSKPIDLIEITRKIISLEKKTLAIGFFQFFSIGCRVIATAVATRTLGVKDYGLVAILLAIGTLLALPIGLGLKSAAIFFLPRYLAQGSIDKWVGFFRLGVSLITLMAAVTFSIIISLFHLMPADKLAISTYTLPEHKEFFYLAIAYAYAFSLSNFSAEVIKASNMPVLSAMLAQFSLGGLTLFCVAAAALTNGGWVVISGGFLCAQFMVAVSSTWICLSIKKSKPKFEAKLWLKFATPLILSGASLIALAQLPIVIAGTLLSSEAAGAYSVVYRLGALPALITAAVNTSYAPSIVAEYRRGSLLAVRKIYKRVLLINAFIITACCIFITLFCENLLSIFGADFVNYKNSLFVILFGLCFSACVGPVAYFLLAAGRNWEVVASYSTVAVGTAILCVVVSKSFGVLGISACVSAGMIAQTSVQTFLLRRAWIKNSQPATKLV